MKRTGAICKVNIQWKNFILWKYVCKVGVTKLWQNFCFVSTKFKLCVKVYPGESLIIYFKLAQVKSDLFNEAGMSSLRSDNQNIFSPQTATPPLFYGQFIKILLSIVLCCYMLCIYKFVGIKVFTQPSKWP